jgi:uncharacterized protein (DUF433 family)
MEPVANLLDRPTYGLAEVDELLGLSPGTARRWIEGYERRRRFYDPVVREEPTGSEVVTWGEFVEARLLAEYRGAGVPIVRLRPAVQRLREVFGPYPLAHADPFLDVEGRELVQRVQEEVGLGRSPLRLVVVRNDQAMLTPRVERFVESADYGTDSLLFQREDGRVVERLFPLPHLRDVVFDPLVRSGRPVVRAVPTEVIAEQVRAGDSIATIAEAYELRPEQVEAAIRYELLKVPERAA